MKLKEFNSKYSYKADKNHDDWSIITPSSDGMYYGDCEDYCLTLKKLTPQFKDWCYYYCKLNGEGNCVLYKNGDIIDCNTQKIVSFEQYCKIYKVTEFKKYNWFVIFSKILFSKDYVWIHSLKN